MEETEAELIVEGGFPKTFVPVPEMEPGSHGPVLPPSSEDRRQFAAEQGSPMRAAAHGNTTETALSLVDPTNDSQSQADKFRSQSAAAAKSKSKKGAARKVYTTRIPWNLLDQLEAEKHALQTEQVNRLKFERKNRSGIVTNPNPLKLDPKKAKSFAKKDPVNPDWPKGRKNQGGLRGDNEGKF